MKVRLLFDEIFEVDEAKIMERVKDYGENFQDVVWTYLCNNVEIVEEFAANVEITRDNISD